MSKCTVCKNEVVWEDVIEIFEDDFSQADTFGMESLTESQQLVVEGKVCSVECVEMLD